MTQLDSPDLSVVIPTYNRHELLRLALATLLRQSSANLTCEVLVVDNNSTPETRAVVDELVQTDSRLRYVRETRQGNAHARNTGVVHARAPIIAFLDDDVAVRDNWLEMISSSFKETNADFIGGKVLPRWETPPPSWLTVSNWAPIAALEYGDASFEITADNPLCLLTANIAFKKEVFAEYGGFSPAVQRVGNTIGSLEDHEFLMRLLRAGLSGLYVPKMIVDAYVGTDRMTRDYHRRWHQGHGRFYAIMKDKEWEHSKFQVAGVPSHLFREAASQTAIWIKRILTGATDAAFESECRLRFFYGFLSERQKQS